MRTHIVPNLAREHIQFFFVVLYKSTLLFLALSRACLSLFQALYEGMLVELPFAGFFLSKLLSRHRGNVDIDHLASLDPDVYKCVLPF